MNEEALNYSYELFKKDGYDGSIDDYKTLINTNDEAFNYSHKLFSDDGYSGSIEDFGNLIRQKKNQTETGGQDLPEPELVGQSNSETDSSVTTNFDRIDTGSNDRFSELLNKAPISPGTMDEWVNIRNEFLERPPMQKDNSDLLERLEGLQPLKLSEGFDGQLNTVRDLRNKLAEKEVKANALSKITGKPKQEILDSDGDFEQLKKSLAAQKGGDYATTFGSNLINASAGVAGTPNAIIESIGKMFVSDEEFNAIPEETRDSFFTDLLSSISPASPALGALSSVAESGKERQRELLEDSEKLRELATQYEQSITQDLFVDRDFSQAGKRLAVEGFGSIPSLIQAMMPYVGISSIITGSSANKLEENKKDGDLNTNEVADAWIGGAAEGFFEIFTRRLGKKAIDALVGKEVTEEAAQTLSKSIVENLVKNPVKEGLSEAATTATQKLSEAFVLGDEVQLGDALLEMADSFLIGKVVGAGLGAPTLAGQQLRAATPVETNTETLDNNQSQVEQENTNQEAEQEVLPAQDQEIPQQEEGLKKTFLAEKVAAPKIRFKGLNNKEILKKPKAMEYKLKQDGLRKEVNDFNKLIKCIWS